MFIIDQQAPSRPDTLHLVCTMSSLTTISSSTMAESPEELDTRLSLGIGAPPPVQLEELFPPRRKAKRDSEGTTTAGMRHNKRARKTHSDGDVDDQGDVGGARKKLRLTVEQAALLEESFRAHNILSHAQKHDLARQLQLSPRQVEVWFQNRRARTKLKQTEVDCELLRRWCQRLTDENARLRNQLAEASAAVPRVTAAAMFNVACPSCLGGQTTA